MNDLDVEKPLPSVIAIKSAENHLCIIESVYHNCCSTKLEDQQYMNA
jgi:hypothetical protein